MELGISSPGILGVIGITVSLISIAVLALIGARHLRETKAAGPWRSVVNDPPPLKGIPVLTEYVNTRHGYHGFRVDTYSTKLNKWMEADVWDQKVVAYAEIKPSVPLSVGHSIKMHNRNPS